MEKDKMIEEMAKDIFEYVDTKKLVDVYILHSGISEGVKPLTHNYGLAEFLCNKNYRKIPEGSVVLRKEEYVENLYRQFKDGYKQARKATSEEILYGILNSKLETAIEVSRKHNKEDIKIAVDAVISCIRNKIHELAKEYGVEE
jgi:hypothetical protein